MINIADDNLQQTPQAIPVEDTTNANASAETAKDRAIKFDKVLGEQSPGTDVLASKISFGEESGLRSDLAQQETARKQSELIQNLKVQAEQGNFPKMEDLTRLSISPENPDTVIENLWSQKVINSAVATKTDYLDPVRQSMEETPDEMLKRVNTAQGVVYRNEIAKTLAQDISDQWENTSWFSADGIGGVAGNFIPLANWAIIKGQGIENGEGKGEWLTGGILQKMATELYNIQDPYEFKLHLEDNIKKLAAKSIPVAVQYARAMVSYGTSDEFLDNVFTGIDAASLVPAGAIASKVKKIASVSKSETTEALKDVIKANGSLSTNPLDIKAASGDVTGAAKDLVKERVSSFVSKDPNNVSLPLRQNVKSLFNPDVLVANPTSVSQEMSDRISVLLQGNADRLVSLFTDLSTVPRVANPKALDKAIESAKTEIGKKYNQAIDGLVDFQTIPPDTTLANTGYVRAKFGTKNSEPFDSASEAVYWMENEYYLSSGQYRVISENGKFFGVVDQYLPETTDAVRDALIDTGSTTPRTFVGQLLDAARAPNLRGGDEIVSRTEMATRKLGVSASQEMMKGMAEVVSPVVSTLGKEKVKRLNRLLEIDRAYVGPEGQQGRFLNTLDEYTAQYRAVFKDAPSEEEMAAYFTLRQLNDVDYAVRDMGLFRDLARLDVSTHSFSLADGARAKGFKAKPIDNLPDWSKDWTAVTISPAGKPTKIMSSTATEADKALVQNYINSGYKIAQVYEPNVRPLSSVTGDKSIVNFVLAPKFDTEKLTFGNLPYQPGGHREYVSKYFVKQPKISDYNSSGRKLYEGDVVALAFETKAEATKYAQRMDKARELMNAGDDKALAKYLSENLPFKLDQFKKFFMEYTDEAGNIIERRFDPEQKFLHVDNKNNTYNQYGMANQKDLVNLSDNEFNLAAENDRRFLAQRDPELWTVKEVASQGGLVHKLEGARQLDPLSSITRTMRSVMESRFTNDYKIGAIERWIAEFGDTMNVSKEDIRRNPAYYFQNPEFNENFGNKAMLAAAKQSHANIRNFLGVENTIDKMTNTVTQRLADAIYGIAGQRVSDFTAEKLATVSDPSRFFRGMAFHTQMGFFNPIQIAVQGQTAFVISAISPKHGPLASMYALASQMTALTRKEGILKKMEGMLDTIGLDGKVFTESSAEMKKTGWDFVGGESMWSEGTLQPKVFTSKIGQVLDAGTVFFKGTERWLRLSAWHTAFREFRELNPSKTITDIDRANILNRANTLSVNMTSASKANWEKGILSVPTQFMSYQARLMDMVWGKQLSIPEKARTLGMMAFMYGLPGAGAGATGYSAYDALRTYALDNGYDLSGTALAGVIEGIPHLVAQQMGLGEWNYSSRYGPSGFTAIQDLIEGDKGLIETLMGPSGSIFNQSVKQSNPTLWAITDVLRGDSASMQLLPQDFIDAARSIATVNSLHNLMIAATAGRYYSKNQVYTADTDWQTMLVSGITGLQPNEIPDAYLLMKNKKSWDELRKTTDSQYIINFQRGILAASEGNTDLANQYWKRARVFLETGHYNPKDQKELYQKAIKNQGSLVAKIKDDYWKNAPAGTEGARLERVLEKAND